LTKHAIVYTIKKKKQVMSKMIPKTESTNIDNRKSYYVKLSEETKGWLSTERYFQMREVDKQLEEEKYQRLFGHRNKYTASIPNKV
jgi:hypothetical protein